MSVALDVASFSAITNYGNLVDRVSARMDRDDLVDQIPMFVALSEHYINRELRVPEMEVTLPLTIANSAVSLPADCLEVRGVAINNRGLRSTSPSELNRQFGDCSGDAYAFAVIGRQIRFAPTTTGVASISYYARVPSLTPEAPSNWLLLDHADVYFYGCLLHASDHVDDPANVQKYAAAFEGAVNRVSEVGNSLRHPGPIIARSGYRAIRGVRA